MDKPINNRGSIKKIASKPNSNVYGVGGGIRSIEILNYYLN
jgi:phosphoribosylformimino-5-aminoimidazole carboxamide ribonucleotide (ProFAR) isomerase